MTADVNYEAPEVVVLGTVAELTQVGTGPTDEQTDFGSET